MKKPFRNEFFAVAATMAACVGLAAVPFQRAMAQPKDHAAGLRIMASDGVKPAVNALLSQMESSTGEKVETEFNASKTLTQEIMDGKPFDVAILTSENLEALIQKGKIVPDSRVEVARAGIGVGVREGSPKPDVSSEEAFRETLLKAKAITFNPSGASSTYFKKICERMGILEKIAPKFILDAAPGRPQMLVAEGKADIVITLIPEVLDSKGVALAGPFPEKLQTYFNFFGGSLAEFAESRKGERADQEHDGTSGRSDAEIGGDGATLISSGVGIVRDRSAAHLRGGRFSK